MLLDQLPQHFKLGSIVANGPAQDDRIKPELCIAVSRLDVNVRWLDSLVAEKEESA